MGSNTRISHDASRNTEDFAHACRRSQRTRHPPDLIDRPTAAYTAWRALGIALLALVVGAAAAAGQVLEVAVPKAALGMAEGAAWPAELDGVPETREWVQYRADGQVRGVALRGGALCTGAWFSPWALVPPSELTVGAVMRAGLIDRWVAQGVTSYYEVRILYGCESGQAPAVVPPPPITKR